MTGEFPHYRVINGNGYWVPTPAMKRAGFRNVPLGKDGHAARAQALIWEERWQEARTGLTRSEYPTGTVGWAFIVIRNLEDWKRSSPAKREEWERGWKYIKLFFADLPPKKVTLVLLDKWYYLLLDKHGVDTAWRAMKTWRALYKFMASLHLCSRDQDPSISIRRLPQNKREQYWTDGEIARLIKGAVRLRMLAVACIISIGWDTIFQPVDSRTLTRKELFRVGRDVVIDRGRVKNGTKVIGWLKRRSYRLLECYLQSLNFELHPDAQIFRTRGHNPGRKGGRPHGPAPYTKNSLGADFRTLRKFVFGPDEKRMLMDLRRSGAMEAVAGDASAAQIGQTLGNNFETSKALQTTYAPNHLASVKKVEAARRRGRRQIGSAENQFKSLKFGWENDLPTDD